MVDRKHKKAIATAAKVKRLRTQADTSTGEKRKDLLRQLKDAKKEADAAAQAAEGTGFGRGKAHRRGHSGAGGDTAPVPKGQNPYRNTRRVPCPKTVIVRGPFGGTREAVCPHCGGYGYRTERR